MESKIDALRAELTAARLEMESLKAERDNAIFATKNLAADRHHPQCEHYAPPQPDPRHAVFGRLMWEMIQKMGGDFCWDEWSDDVLPLAEKAGLCSRVIYDPEKHGNGIEAEPGDEIWWWGEDGSNESAIAALAPGEESDDEFAAAIAAADSPFAKMPQEIERLRNVVRQMLDIFDPRDDEHLDGLGPGEIDAIMTARAVLDVPNDQVELPTPDQKA